LTGEPGVPSAGSLGLVLLFALAIPLAVIILRRGTRLFSWISDRLYPLALCSGCFCVGLVVALLSEPFFALVKPSLLFATASEPPAGVTGPDLVANLLSISALTISACLAFLCLPKDRVETRIASHVRVCLLNELIEEKDFWQFYNQLDNAMKATPACKAVRGFLQPRASVGGWYHLTDADLSIIFGSGDWNHLRKFVDEHLDESWIRVLLGALSLGMMLGFICLGYRYLGLAKAHIVPAELGTILTLAGLNAVAGFTAAGLAIGGRAGEKTFQERIIVHVRELKPHIAAYQSQRRNEGLEKMAEKIEEVAGQPTSLDQ
jgi:hypothetical protein